MRPPPESKPFHSKNEVAPPLESELRRRYSAVRYDVPKGAPVTLLHIGTEQTVLVTGSNLEPEALLTLGIGSRRTANEYFKHVPPTPAEMENAIAAVENEVVRARAGLVDGSALVTTDATIREIALLSGVAAGAELGLGLEAMERTFERLAAVTLGRPASREGLPTGAAFAATLLILREVMHHLRFSSITVKA